MFYVPYLIVIKAGKDNNEFNKVLFEVCITEVVVSTLFSMVTSISERLNSVWFLL